MSGVDLTWLDDDSAREKCAVATDWLKRALLPRYPITAHLRNANNLLLWPVSYVFLEGVRLVGPAHANTGSFVGKVERSRTKGPWLDIRLGGNVPTCMLTRQPPLYPGKPDKHGRIDQMYVDAASALWRLGPKYYDEAQRTITQHLHQPKSLTCNGMQQRKADGKLVAEWFNVEGRTMIRTWDEAAVWTTSSTLFYFLREEKLIEGRATEAHSDAFADAALQEFQVAVLAGEGLGRTGNEGNPNYPNYCEALKTDGTPCASVIGLAWWADKRLPGMAFKTCAAHQQKPPGKGYGRRAL